MATVPNLARAGIVDKSFVVPNRMDVAAPCTPQYAGEIVTGIVGSGAGASWGAFVATSLDPKSWVPYGIASGINDFV